MSTEDLSLQLEDARSRLKDREEEIKVLQLQVRLLKEALVEKETPNDLKVEVVHKPKKIVAKSKATEKHKDLDHSAELQNEIKSLKQQIEDLQHEKQQQNKSQSQTGVIDNLHQQLNSLEKETSSLKQRNQELEQKLKSSEGQYQTEIENLRQTIAKLEKNITQQHASIEQMTQENQILKQDRILLNEQITKIAEDKSQLSSENFRLKEDIKTMKDGIAEMSKQLESAIVDANTNNAVAAKARSLRDAAEDKAFQQKYGLPDTEFPITYYNCSRNLKTGYLYITPHYVVFDAYVNVFSEHKTVIEMVDIQSINKVKAFGFMPGKGSDLEIRVFSNNGEVILFRNFMRRNDAVRDIVQQARNINHIIQTLRDGQPDQKQF